MKKRYLALILAVAVLVLGLVACGQAQNQEEQQEPQNLDVLDVQQTEPVDTAEPVESDTPDEPEETQTPENKEPGDNSEADIVSDDELIYIFKYAYDMYKDTTLDIGAKIEAELNYISGFASDLMPGKQLPEDYIERYIDWRPIDGEESLFNDCNETVYATIDMNIRESWSTSSTKIGSLAKGKSVTRIGVGIAGTEAEGWSMVQLSGGTVAYMVSSYLSTTKPATGGGNGGGNGGGSQQGGGGSGGGSQQGGGGSGGGSGSGDLHGADQYPDHLGGTDGTDYSDDYHDGYDGHGWGSGGSTDHPGVHHD